MHILCSASNPRDLTMRSRSILLLPFVLLSPLIGGIALAQSTKSLPVGKAPGTFEVKVSQGYLSLEATEAPLVQVFQEIGKQAKITFDSNVGPNEKITIHLDRVPFEDGIKQLAKNVTIFYTENPKDKSRRISRVVVLSAGSGVSGQVKASPEAEKAKESAPRQRKYEAQQQPEPFKFEFDPGKFAQKEKPRKQP